MFNDIIDRLRCLQSNTLVDINCVKQGQAQETLYYILLELITAMTATLDRLDNNEALIFEKLERFDRYEHETSVDSVQEKLKNIDVSLCKACKDIEDLKNEAVFRSIL